MGKVDEHRVALDLVEDEDGALVGDPARTFRVVTLSFVADGGDGYPFPATGRVDLEGAGLPDGIATFAPPGTEQDALAEYLEAVYPTASPFGIPDVPASDDERVQDLSRRSDTVIP